jgi:hypothetical protein
LHAINLQEGKVQQGAKRTKSLNIGGIGQKGFSWLKSGRGGWLEESLPISIESHHDFIDGWIPRYFEKTDFFGSAACNSINNEELWGMLIGVKASPLSLSSPVS